jgi:hypothetical protein
VVVWPRPAARGHVAAAGHSRTARYATRPAPRATSMCGRR